VYPLTPMKVYALERVKDDPACVARMERIIGALANKPELMWITEENLPEAVAELSALWPPEEVPEGQMRSYMRPLVFTTLDFGYKLPDLTPMLERLQSGLNLNELNLIFGRMTTAIDQHPHERDQHNNSVCWPTYNLGTISGCSHGCLYCGAGRSGRFLAVALNLEDYMAKVVGPVIETNPWNKVFRMILSGSDLISFEPEYGLFDLFARKLAEYDDRYGYFHTTSSNVEWLADIEHRDRIIGVWSTTCEAVARDIETGTGKAIDRVDAAAKCQKMGIPVRFKFKPVIPVKNWREEYAWIIEQMLKRTTPESIGFSLYIWNTFESMEATIPLELLDPDCVSAARESANEMKGVRTGPFPHNIRKEIYQFLIREVRRWDKEVPLYVCTESREMWDELTGELGQDPRDYICGCGSVAVPGRKLALSPAFRYSTYHPTPI